MREANRKAFIRVVGQDPGIQILDEPFRFSGDRAGAVLLPDVVAAIGETFREVGGKEELDPERIARFVYRLRVDDRVRVDGDEFVVEYDEPQHFTTFRRSTLASNLYKRLRVGFDPLEYGIPCGTVRIAASSGFAHNDSAHRDFECPRSPRECRHRQRAFYDFLKDVLHGLRLDGSPALIRISDFEAIRSLDAGAAIDLLRRRARWATRE